MNTYKYKIENPTLVHPDLSAEMSMDLNLDVTLLGPYI